MTLARVKIHCQRIDAKTGAGQGGAVVKDVSQMRMAVGAGYFGAPGAAAVIGSKFDASGQGGVKTRPAASAVKFLFGSKQRVAAGGADIYAEFVKHVIFAGKSRFGAFVM